MNAVQVVRGADGDTVVARVVAAARAVEDVVIVQARPGRARGDRAPPAVALEDGVTMPGTALPLGRHVAEQALEALPGRCVRRREGADGGPEERYDRGGTLEAYLRVAAARTHLHLVQRRQHERRLRRRGLGRARLDRPVDEVTQAADRHLVRAGDPRRFVVRVDHG